MNTITTECPECGSDDYRQLTTDTGHNQCNECRQEWWRDVDYTKPLTHGGDCRTVEYDGAYQCLTHGRKWGAFPASEITGPCQTHGGD